MWYSDYEVAYEDQAIRLLCFQRGETPVLIVPPQAGHHSFIADFDDGQSLVQCAMKESSDFGVYAVEWKTCTFERRYEGIVDLVMQLDRAVDKVPGYPYLVGLCQGGWLSAIYAALYPNRVSSRGMTLAGAPIDTHAGDSSLHSVVKMPLWWFGSLVMMGGGLMRGDLMLMGWKSSDPMQHYYHRYVNPKEGSERFNQWYDYTQDLSGVLYLWIIEFLFQKNFLGKNQLEVNGQHVDLRNIRGHINVVVGKKDTITPEEQASAILKYCNGSVHEINAGHIGVFMSHKGIESVWKDIFSSIELIGVEEKVNDSTGNHSTVF